jgi:hypothetical protein
MEALCLMVQMRRQLIQLYGMHTVVQAVMTANDDSSDAARDSFKKYQNSLMPFLEDEINREQEELVKALKSETMRGPLYVKSLISDRKSQLRKKLRKTPIKTPTAPWKRRGRRGHLSSVRMPP